MDGFVRERLRPLAPGLILALLTLCFGFGLGGAFGAIEDSLKEGLSSSAEAALDSVYGGDRAKMDAVVKKSWVYYKRAHLHANGLGTSALGPAPWSERAQRHSVSEPCCTRSSG
jgi:hypothetical protein